MTTHNTRNCNIGILLSATREYQLFLAGNDSFVCGSVKRNHKHNGKPISVSLRQNATWVVNKVLPLINQRIHCYPMFTQSSLLVGVGLDLPKELEEGTFFKIGESVPVFWKRNETASKTEVEVSIDTSFGTDKLRSTFLWMGGHKFFLSVFGPNGKKLILPNIPESGLLVEEIDFKILTKIQAIWPELNLGIKKSDEGLRIFSDLVFDSDHELIQVSREIDSTKILVSEYGKRIS